MEIPAMMMAPMMAAKEKLNPKIKWDGTPKTMSITLVGADIDRESRRIMVTARVKRRKMSRKRFERMLMAIGVYPRKTRVLADAAREVGLPYEIAFEATCFAASAEADAEDAPQEEKAE